MSVLDLRYVSLLAGSAVVPRLPVRLAYRGADVAARLAFRYNHRAREAVLWNLRHVLGPAAPDGLIEAYGREVFRTSSRNYVDLLRLPTLPIEAIERQVECYGFEHAVRALAAGRGVIIAAAHFGNFDVVGRIQRRLAVDLTVLVEPLRPPALLSLISGLRSARGLRFVPVQTGALRDAVRRLRRGEMVGLAVDRAVVGARMPLPFFGVEALMPTGAASLAVRTGALLLPACGVRRDDGYAVFVEPPIEPAGSGDLAVDVRATAQAVLGVVEQYIRRWPGQWIVFEPIWPMEGAGCRVPGSLSRPSAGLSQRERRNLSLSAPRGHPERARERADLEVRR